MKDKKFQKQKKVCIVGGGASGLFAGILLARRGVGVTILEQNESPGKKLLATGNGRCNLTNIRLKKGAFRGEDPVFLETIIRAFPPKEVLSFFSDLGLLTIEKEGWIYPLSEQSETVLHLLLAEAERWRIRIKNLEPVIAIHRSEKGGKNIPGKDTASFLVQTKGWSYPCDTVVVATGGPASAVRGSSDKARDFASAFSLKTLPYRPALVPLKIREPFASVWRGVRINGKIEILSENRPIAEATGQIQLTEYGISGIPVLEVSRFALASARDGKETIARLDFLPGYSSGELAAFLRKTALHHPEKSLKELLIGILPARLIPVILSDEHLDKKHGDFPSGRASGNPDSHENRNPAPVQTGKEIRTAAGREEEREREALVRLAEKIKNFPVHIRKEASLKMAQVSSGGILTSELSPGMEARRVPGLFFIGEAVDCDGTCGGYNLQWAFSSAAACAREILPIPEDLC